MSGGINAYANYRECVSCFAPPEEQTWVDAEPGSAYEGMCTGCALEARGRPLKVDYDPTLQIELDTEKTDALAKKNALSAFTITTAQQRAAFAVALADVKERWKRLDHREKLITKPALESIESARELFRAAKAAYVAIEECIKDKLAAYEARCAVEVAAAQEQADALEAAGDVEGARNALMLAGEVPPPGDENMIVKHPWAWEVHNIEMVAKEFLLVNSKEVTAEMRRQLAEHPDQTPVLAGITFHRAIQITPKPAKRAKTPAVP